MITDPEIEKNRKSLSLMIRLDDKQLIQLGLEADSRCN